MHDPPPPTGLRPWVEGRSEVPLRRLTGGRKFALPVLAAALLLAGLGLPPLAGLPFLVLLALLVGWLSYLSWPVLSQGGRVVRLVTLTLVVLAPLRRLLLG